LAVTDIRLFLDERGFDWKLSDFSSSAFAPHAHELHWLFCERDSVDTGTSRGPRLNFDYNLGANSFAAATASSAFDAAWPRGILNPLAVRMALP